jgi:O-acetyl-ADP-ribose deacetylase
MSNLSVDVRSLPTLNDLYASGELTVPETVANAVLKGLERHVKPSAAINDKIVFYRGDITKLKADAIVNAANRMLMGGGGVDGAIHRAAGRQLLDACIPLGGCQTGDAKITPGFRLPARFVIHTVGPVYDDLDPLDSNRLLANCYTNSLQRAVEVGQAGSATATATETETELPVRTVAFCAISTGIYGFPSQAAAAQAVSAVRKFLESEKGAEIYKVVFVTFEMKDVIAYQKALA